MTKKRNGFYEEMVFDDVQFAIDTAKECQAKLVKAKNGLVLAFFATAYFFLGTPIVTVILEPVFRDNAFSIAMGSAAAISLIAYSIGGGLGTALKWAWKLAVFGWIIIPFPYDLIVGFMTMGFSLACFICFPILFVYLSYRQIKKDYAAAKKYLSYFKAQSQKLQVAQAQTVARQPISQSSPASTHSPVSSRTSTVTRTAPRSQYTSASRQTSSVYGSRTSTSRTGSYR